MPKDAEIQYVVNMAKMLKVSSAEVEHHLVHKPFCRFLSLDISPGHGADHEAPSPTAGAGPRSGRR